MDTVDKMLKNLWIMEISKPFDIISFLKSFPAALRGGVFARNPQVIADFYFACNLLALVGCGVIHGRCSFLAFSIAIPRYMS